MATLPLSSPTSAPPLTSSANSGYRGEIIVALKFVPPPKVRSSTSDTTTHSSTRRARGMLMVLVKEAKNLVPVARGATNADPFCKWYATMQQFLASQIWLRYAFFSGVISAIRAVLFKMSLQFSKAHIAIYCSGCAERDRLEFLP